MPRSNSPAPEDIKSSDAESSGPTVEEDEDRQSSAREAHESASVQNLAPVGTAGRTHMRESRLWMKTVIDAIHGDIQSRGINEQYPDENFRILSFSRCTVRESTSGKPSSDSVSSLLIGRVDLTIYLNRDTSNDSPRREKKEEYVELNRIQDFMTDTSLPATLIEGNASTTDSRRRMAAKLNEFDEIFENASKDNGSG